MRSPCQQVPPQLKQHRHGYLQASGTPHIIVLEHCTAKGGGCAHACPHTDATTCIFNIHNETDNKNEGDSQVHLCAHIHTTGVLNNVWGLREEVKKGLRGVGW